MKLTKLGLKNFRNCADISLDFENKKTLIIGKNAQGKTNILESIYFLSALKPIRTSALQDLIQFGKDKFEIKADIEKNITDISLEYSYDTDKKREMKVNGLKTSPSNFKQVMKTVLFSTKDLLLLRGAPQDRRDWLDRAISQVYPAYDDRLSKYDKIRIQKNNLLKGETVDENLYDIYNEQLVITGANIIFLRKKYLKEIEKNASLKHKAISETETFGLCYDFEGEEIEEISENLRKKLEEKRKEEFARHQSCAGPHRDDIIFKINGNDAVKFASQGQQRTLVLSLKLAELDIIKEKTGFSPVLLLDDVLAELDDMRQNYLLKSIGDETQTIITSVDTLPFDKDFLEKVAIYSVKNGGLSLN